MNDKKSTGIQQGSDEKMAPILSLPAELLLDLMEFLPMETLFNMSMIGDEQIKKCAVKSLSRLSFIDLNEKMPNENIKTYFTEIGPYIRTIKITEEISDIIPNNFVDFFPKLENIKFQNFPIRPKDTQAFSAIKSLELISCRSLKSFLHSFFNINEIILRSTHLPPMEENHEIPSLRHFAYFIDSISDRLLLFLRKNHQLKSIRLLSSTKHEANHSTKAFLDTLREFSDLKIFWMIGTHKIHNITAYEFINCFKSLIDANITLRELYLNCFPPEVIDTIVEFSEMEVLMLKPLKGVTFKQLLTIARRMKNLKELTISGLGQIPAEILIEFLETAKNIEKLRIISPIKFDQNLFENCLKIVRKRSSQKRMTIIVPFVKNQIIQSQRQILKVLNFYEDKIDDKLIFDAIYHS